MVILAYSKITNHSQKVPRTSAPLGNVLKTRQLPNKAREAETFSARHITVIPPFFSALFPCL